MRRAIGILIITCILLAGGVMESGFALAQNDRIIARLGPGAWPQWSPDGRWLSFAYGGFLYVTPADSFGSPTPVLPLGPNDYQGGPNYVWLTDSSIVNCERTRGLDSATFKTTWFKIARHSDGKSAVVSDIAFGRERKTRTHEPAVFVRVYGPVRLIDGAVGHVKALGSILGPLQFVPLNPEHELTSRERNWPVLYTHREGDRFAPLWGEIWKTTITAGLGDPGRRLTDDQQFGHPTVSPDGDRFIVLNMLRECWMIFDTAGNEIVNSIAPFERDPAAGTRRGSAMMRWSPNGQLLAYLSTVEDDEGVLSQSVRVCDDQGLATREVLSPNHGSVLSLEWHPRSTALAIATSASGILIVETK